LARSVRYGFGSTPACRSICGVIACIVPARIVHELVGFAGEHPIQQIAEDQDLLQRYARDVNPHRAITAA